MKKILFATTALVASAGIASAQGVEVSGSAEVGIVGGERRATTFQDEGVSQLWTDVEVLFTLTGEADNGLTYGAKIDLDEAMNANGTDDGGASLFLAFAGARLDLGDTDGAFDAALTEVAAATPGTIDDTETAYFGYSGNSGLDAQYDNQIARFSYSFDAFTGYLSTEIDDNGQYEPVYGVGFSYAGNMAGFNLGVGVGYQHGDEDNADATTAAADAIVMGPDGIFGDDPATVGIDESADDATNDLTVLERAFTTPEAEEAIGVSLSVGTDNGFIGILNYSETEYGDLGGVVGDERERHSAIGLGYNMNALSLGVSYSEFDNRFGIDGLEANGYAVSTNYDLGGGLTAQAGYSQGEFTMDGGDELERDSYSVGLSMSF